MEPNDTNENTQRTPSAHTGQSEILPHVRVCCEVDTNIESVDVVTRKIREGWFLLWAGFKNGRPVFSLGRTDSITLKFDEVTFEAGEGVFSLTARSGTDAERDIRAYADSFGPPPSREEALENRRRTASWVNDKKLALKTEQVTVAL